MGNKKMKVCILTQNIYTLGGIQKVVTTLTNELVYDDKYEISILMPFKDDEHRLFPIDEAVSLYYIEDFVGSNKLIARRVSGKILSLNAKRGFLDKKILFPIIYMLRYTKKRRERLIQFFNQFDVVIGTGFGYSLLLGEMSERLTCKTIGWQHSTFDSYFERQGFSGYGLKKYAKLAYKKLDQILVLTEADKKVFDESLNIDSIVFYNPIPNRGMSRTECHNHNILFVGRLDKYHKGLEYLVTIMKETSSQISEAKYFIVGDGPDRQWLVDEVKNVGLEEQVIFVGKTNDVDRYYCDATVLLQTSRFEGFGMTIVEAMSHGVPIVSFHNYGPDEIIQDDVNGYLIEKFDTDKFSERVVALSNNESERKRISDACLERAQDFFVERKVIQFNEIVSNLLK